MNDSYSVKELIHTNDLLAEKMEEERTEEGKNYGMQGKFYFGRCRSRQILSIMM